MRQRSFSKAAELIACVHSAVWTAPLLLIKELIRSHSQYMSLPLSDTEYCVKASPSPFDLPLSNLKARRIQCLRHKLPKSSP